MRLIYIEWQDAHSPFDGWKSKEEMERFFKSQDFYVKQVGWLYKETKLYILLAGQYVPDGEFVDGGWGNIIKIPKGWIKKRIDLTKHIK